MRSRVIDRNQTADAKTLDVHYESFPQNRVATSPLNGQARPNGTGQLYGYQPRPSLQAASQAKKTRVPFTPTDGWLVLALLAVALYSVVYAVIAAQWVSPHDELLVYSPAAGLLVGYLISKIPRFPQAVLHLGACLIGHWLAIWLTSSIAFHVPWTTVLTDLRAAFTGQLLSEGIDGSRRVFFFYLTFLCFFLGYFGSWLVYRARLPWLVALVYSSIMLVNLNYVKASMNYLVIFLVLALSGSLALLIARMSLTTQVLQWMREGLHTDRNWMRAITMRCMQVACVIAVVTLLLSWVLPTPAQPASGKLLWDHLDAAWNDLVTGRFSWQDINTLTSSQPNANFFGDQLTVSESVQLPAGEVLDYKSSDGSQNNPHYLEGFTYNRFDGRTWTTTLQSTDPTSFAAGTVLPPDGSALGSSGTIAVTVIVPPGGTKNYIFGPTQPSQFDMGTLVYSDGTAGEWVQQQPLQKNETYHVKFVSPDVNPAALSQQPLPANNNMMYSNGSTIPQDYYQLPSDLSPAVQQDAHNWTKNATNMYQELQLLEQHLSDKNVFTYSVNNRPIPPGVDVVDDLLQTHTGYCTYYASAMAVMARILHIPTRVVNGFSNGHLDMTRNIWEVDGSDAHSWVQSYFPNVGWINFDPTPGFALGAMPTSPAPNNPQSAPTAAPKTNPVAQPTPPVVATATPTPAHHVLARQSSSQSAVSKPISGTLILVSLIVLGMLALLFCAAAMLRYWWRNLYANSTFVAGLYWRFCRIAGLIGLAPRNWQTPYEYSGVLSRRFPQKSREIWHLTELFVRDRWGPPHAQDPRVTQDAQRLWTSLRSLFIDAVLGKSKKS